MTTGKTKRALPELRAWMKRTNTNQGALARLLGVSDAQVSLCLRGLRHWSVNDAARLAVLTDIPVEKLLTGKDAVRLLKLLGKQQTVSPENIRDKSNVA